MDWLEPDWAQERPTDTEVRQARRAWHVTRAPMAHPAVDRVLAALREVNTNGGALFARFAVGHHPVLHWFASRNRWDEIHFPEHFLRSAAVREQLPELRLGRGLAVAPEFEWGSAFTLDGELAQTLVAGGAYGSFAGTAREAKELGARFCDALFGDRLAEVLVYRSFRPWAPWFHDVAWDRTWLVVDKRQRALSLLCCTDTD